MVSIERDLLKRVRDTLGGLKETYYDLYWDIQTVLAQPKQEPVAWITEWEEKQVPGSIWSDQTKRSLSFTREGAMAVLHPNYIPLYTAPPKREPLNEDKLDVLAEARITDEGFAGYYAGFRDAEKHHGIGVGDE